jgi:hypothetical protein
MVKCSNGNLDCRSFKIAGSGIGFKGGRYVSKGVYIAAKRAGSKLFQKLNDPAYKKHAKKNKIKFILIETTKGSKKKTRAYEATRSKLSQPVTTIINGKRITYKYTYSIKRLADVTEVSKLMT